VTVLLRTTKEAVVHQAAETLSEKLIEQFGSLDVLGPAPAPYSRLRNQFRYQILIKGTDNSLIPCLNFLRAYRPAKAFMSVDVDHMDLL